MKPKQLFFDITPSIIFIIQKRMNFIKFCSLILIYIFVILGTHSLIVHANTIKIDPKVDFIMKSSRSIDVKIKELKKIGNADAALALGLIYEIGIGGAKIDKHLSAKWYKKGAEKGNTQAQYFYGMCLETGTAIPMDLEKAAYWLRKAANKGHKDAIEELKRVKKNMWMNKSSWVSVDTVCQSGIIDCNKTIMVTSNSFVNHWAGEIIEMYHIKNSDDFTRYKISITWLSDNSKYRCGQIIEKRVEDVKDFKVRSIALKKCK